MQLKGTCNRCGLCCHVFGFRCINLIVRNTPGEPEATRCAVYADRYENMPILLLDEQGRIRGKSFCHVGETEIEGILEKGIGHGCSLEVIQDG